MTAVGVQTCERAHVAGAGGVSSTSLPAGAPRLCHCDAPTAPVILPPSPPLWLSALHRTRPHRAVRAGVGAGLLSPPPLDPPVAGRQARGHVECATSPASSAHTHRRHLRESGTLDVTMDTHVHTQHTLFSSPKRCLFTMKLFLQHL